MRTIRFLLTTLVMTVWCGGRAIVAAWRGVQYQPGGIYDRASIEWGRTLLQVNKIPLRVEGLSRIDPTRPYVYASNHVSLVDIWALLATIPQSFRFVAKAELLRVPIFGPALTAAGHISIDRRRLKSAFHAYDDAAKAIQGGLSAAVFVEGTRSRDGRLLPFKRGPFVLAIQAGVPVVPVYVAGTRAVLPRGSFRIRPGPVEIRLGEPIPTAGLTEGDRDALSQRTRSAMEALRDGVDPSPTRE